MLPRAATFFLRAPPSRPAPPRIISGAEHRQSAHFRSLLDPCTASAVRMQRAVPLTRLSVDIVALRCSMRRFWIVPVGKDNAEAMFSDLSRMNTWGLFLRLSSLRPAPARGTVRCRGPVMTCSACLPSDRRNCAVRSFRRTSVLCAEDRCA